MVSKLGKNNFQISSFTDNNGGAICPTTTTFPLNSQGNRPYYKCQNDSDTNCCHHAQTSCHYGGSGSCYGKSYAADISKKGSGAISSVPEAASNCGAKTLDEGNHIHISVGSQAGCGCDDGL